MREVIAAHMKCDERFSLRPYSGSMILFRAAKQPQWLGMSFDDPEMGWGGYVRGQIRICEIPGGHLEIFRGENLKGLVSALRRELAAPDHERIERAEAGG